MSNQAITSLEYLEKEIDYLRETYSNMRKEIRGLETYSLLAAGVVFSWYAANGNNYKMSFIIWLPFIVVNLFGIRSLGIYMQMRTILMYLEKYEKHQGIASGLGWEKFKKEDKARLIVTITSFAFWIILSILTSAIPFLI